MQLTNNLTFNLRASNGCLFCCIMTVPSFASACLFWELPLLMGSKVPRGGFVLQGGGMHSLLLPSALLPACACLCGMTRQFGV